MRLRLKFNIILAVCYLLGLSLSIYPFYQISRREAMEQLQSQIDVLRAQALSIRRYTSEEIQPLLAEHSSIQFLPQTVPSFSAQTAFRILVAILPRSPFTRKPRSTRPTLPILRATGSGSSSKSSGRTLTCPRTSASRQSTTAPTTRNGVPVGDQGRSSREVGQLNAVHSSYRRRLTITATRMASAGNSTRRLEHRSYPCPWTLPKDRSGET